MKERLQSNIRFGRKKSHKKKTDPSQTTSVQSSSCKVCVWNRTSRVGRPLSDILDHMRRLPLSLLILLISLAYCPASMSAQSASERTSFTEISADLGSCSALILVTGTDAKPVYGAKIATRVHYGMMGAKRVDLETYTGSEGQVKITHLPALLKKPMYIHITKGDFEETVEFKPEERCNATFKVELH